MENTNDRETLPTNPVSPKEIIIRKNICGGSSRNPWFNPPKATIEMEMIVNRLVNPGCYQLLRETCGKIPESLLDAGWEETIEDTDVEGELNIVIEEFSDE